MNELQHPWPGRLSSADRPVARSSISPSSTSAMSADLSPSTLQDVGASETDPDVADYSETALVKAERGSNGGPTSPTKPRISSFEVCGSPGTPSEASSKAAVVPQKRGRGRPKKNVVNMVTLPSPKIKSKTFVRSKTGCFTCRERKKKCDERKPECLNCENNGFFCKGYAPKREWQPGKAKNRAGSFRVSVATIPKSVDYIFAGLETDIDTVFFAHYCDKVSTVLTSKGNDPLSNPFLSLIVPLASNDPVVMHSLLGLSGAHLLRSDQRADYRDCKTKHIDKSIEYLNEAVGKASSSNTDVSDGVVACLVLQYQLQVTDGSQKPEYLYHYTFARDYVKFKEQEPMGRFAAEFFEFARLAISMTSLSRVPSDALDRIDEASPPSHELRFAISEVVNTYDGIMHKNLIGLCPIITRITTLRDHVRRRKALKKYQTVDYMAIRESERLNRSLKEWDSGQEEGSLDWLTGQLYREAAFVYLHRTIRISKPDEALSLRVHRGIVLLEQVSGADPTTNCFLLLPTFLFGCAAFETQQRERIDKVFEKLESSNDFGNVGPSKEIVDQVWRMMDRGDENSWDWETIKEHMNMDFPIT